LPHRPRNSAYPSLVLGDVSYGGFLLRFLLGLCASLCALVLAAGCAVTQISGAVVGPDGGSWATQAELTWLEKLGAWDQRLMRGLRHGRGLGPTVTCTSDLLRRVGPPPSERLRIAQAAFGRACKHLERFEKVVTLANYQGSDREIRAAQVEARRASALLLKADQMLPPGEVRALPVIGGDSAESRIEPRFGRIASVLAGKELAVRCWSGPDWRRLIREEGIYTRGLLGSDTLGFAGIYGDRANLGPNVCASLVALTYRGARPTGEAARLLLATAVVTLSHEPQHSKGVVQESVAECNAIQLAHRTAAKLGASREFAAALVRTYWRHYKEQLPAYRSLECRDGGALDRDYAGSIWR
jgi:hypothetical protein